MAKATILKLEKSGINIKDKSIDGSTSNSIILRDPNNFGISIIKFDTSTLPKLSGNPNRKCGIFGEFSIPVNDLKESIEFWEKLGYSVQKQIDKPYPQVILSDGLFIVGLHQTDSFVTPAITYFSKDAPKRIQQLETEGLEITYPPEDSRPHQNGILKSPSGQLIFIFYGENDN